MLQGCDVRHEDEPDEPDMVALQGIVVGRCLTAETRHGGRESVRDDYQ
jgi:hypothetical protein